MGQQPGGHRLEGDLEEPSLGKVLLGGASSNQTVSWIVFRNFELYVWGTDSLLILLAFLISGASVVARVCT